MTIKNRDPFLLYGAAFFRSLGIGFNGVVMAISLSEIGFSVARIGVIVALGLAGGAAGTLIVSLGADRIGRRKTLLLLSSLQILGGLVATTQPRFTWMAAAAFFGMINGMGRDRGAAFSLEQSILSEHAKIGTRTKRYAGYSLILDIGLATGSLMGGLPAFLRGIGGAAPWVYHWTFGISTLCAAIPVIFYLGLSAAVETASKKAVSVSPQSRQRISRMAGISAIDSLGGGFLTGALISYWFFHRFSADETMIGPIFLFARIANAASYFGAVWLSRKIGLLNTMVFTHIPSNLLLIALPFAPTFPIAVFLFLLRECIVEMDLPTRQSYLVAVVRPEERTFATGVVNLTRTSAWAVAPSISGYVMSALSVGSPLLLGGVIKLVYDGLLLAAFRRVAPRDD